MKTSTLSYAFLTQASLKDTSPLSSLLGSVDVEQSSLRSAEVEVKVAYNNGWGNIMWEVVFDGAFVVRSGSNFGVLVSM